MKKFFPPNVWTVEQSVAYIRKIVGHEGLRVTRFKIETVTESGDTLNLSWDHKHVGQKPSHEAQP